MDYIKRISILLLATFIAVSGTTQSALADDYPNRPVTLVVASGAGGSTDTAARIMAINIQDHLGQPVQGSIRIAAADAFDKGGNGVVMLITVTVINDGLFLDAFLGHRHGHSDHAIGLGRRGERGNFQRIERLGQEKHKLS